MKKFTKSIVNIFDTKAPFTKTFLLDADDDVMIGDRSVSCGVMIHLTIESRGKILYITQELYAWSNEQQEYMPLESSIWSQKSFGNHIQDIYDHYEPIVAKLFEILTKLKHLWVFEDLFYRFNNPLMSYHHKLLNLFTQDELKVVVSNFILHTRINVYLLKSEKVTQYDVINLTLPCYFNGFFINGFEVSVDLNSDSFPIIENLEEGGVVDKETFLSKIKL